jgi:hypothetical protein
VVKSATHKIYGRVDFDPAPVAVRLRNETDPLPAPSLAASSTLSHPHLAFSLLLPLTLHILIMINWLVNREYCDAAVDVTRPSSQLARIDADDPGAPHIREKQIAMQVGPRAGNDGQ